MAREVLLPEQVRADIQGFVTSGYGHLPQSAYLFIQVHDAAGARRWLQRVLSTVTPAETWPVVNGRTAKPIVAVNIAFSAEGLAALGLPAAALCTFPPEFREGIAAPDRSRILGDTDDSDPGQWALGGPRTPPLHAMVLVHAQSGPGLADACSGQRALLGESDGAVSELPGTMQAGYRPDGDYEPFGFHDGISQPRIAGLAGDGVPTGEFILGYPNHFAIVAPTPVVAPELDPGGLLPRSANPVHAAHGLRDLGTNGSFAVYRKLRQDVAGFWQFMRREAMRVFDTGDPGAAIGLAARCLGRWPSGAPLVFAPDTDAPEHANRDDFLYRADPAGLACPIGAHIRRTNPRDDLKPYSSAESLSMSEAHRLLRRARAFGPPLFDPLLLRDPARLAGSGLDLADDGIARGIHFFCVNANISRQFEFVQQTWCNNPRFGGLHDNKDPLIGDNGRPDRPTSHMTIPRRPVRIRTAPLPRFVTVEAGAYLFMPSLAALRFLAAL